MHWLIAVALLVQAAQAAASDDVRDWLQQMSQAAQGLNYRGTFVYLHNGQLEAMRVIHGVVDGAEQERLVALTGEAREVIRDQERVTCILPKSKAVMVDRSIPRKPFPAALPRDLADLDDNYEFLAMGEDRVSGLPSRIVVIKPRDHYRYGYRLWLERDSSLLLRSDLVDADGTPIEQMMFTELQVLDELDTAELKPMLTGEDYTWFGHQEKTPVKTAPAGPAGWQVGWLPGGFMLTHHNRHAMPSDAAEVEHMVYSDGLATVSIYIEPANPDKAGLAGSSRMGAVNALGVRLGDHQITVVGEVPRSTVEQIGKSVQRRP